MNAFKKAVFAAVVAAAGFSTGAQASIIGERIFLNNDANSKIVIGDNLEFSSLAGYLDFNFSATQLIVTISKALPDNFSFANSLSAFVFKGFTEVITDFALVTNAPQFKNFDENDYSFTNNTLTLKFAGVTPQNDQARLVFDITTASSIPAPGNNVPEPATVALLGLGLLGVAAARRKSVKRTGV